MADADILCNLPSCVAESFLGASGVGISPRVMSICLVPTFQGVSDAVKRVPIKFVRATALPFEGQGQPDQIGLLLGLLPKQAVQPDRDDERQR